MTPTLEELIKVVADDLRSRGKPVPWELDPSAPEAVITALSTKVEAGHAIHVHAMASTLGAGKWTEAKIEWDFGDPTGKYNTLEGFNAAHVYDKPGLYTITLTLTNAAGVTGYASVLVTVEKSTRTAVYVDPAGDDNNDGLTPSRPVKTLAMAKTLIFFGNKELLFKRGCTFDMPYGTWNVSITGETNVCVGAYGDPSLPLPIIRKTGKADGGSFISMSDSCVDVTIQDIEFRNETTTGPEQTNRPFVLSARGQNVTIRRCKGVNVGYFFNGSGKPKGWLVQDNETPTPNDLSGYAVWAESDDGVVLGNTFTGSTQEHLIRSSESNLDRLLIAHNKLTNKGKTTINIRGGAYVYIIENELNGAPFGFGATKSMCAKDKTAKAHDIVVRRNSINSRLQIGSPAASDIVIDDCVISQTSDTEAIEVKATDPAPEYAGIQIGPVTIRNTRFASPNSKAIKCYRDDRDPAKFPVTVLPTKWLNITVCDFGKTAKPVIDIPDVSVIGSSTGNTFHSSPVASVGGVSKTVDAWNLLTGGNDKTAP